MNKTNIKNLVVGKSLPIILAGTMVFSLASCGSDYKYVVDKETGIVSLDGTIPYENISKYYVVTYKDLREDINVMLIKATLANSVCELYNVESGGCFAVLNSNDKEEAIQSYVEEEIGAVISIEKAVKYLELYEIKGGYNLEDLKQIKILVKEIKNKDNKVLVKE